MTFSFMNKHERKEKTNYSYLCFLYFVTKLLPVNEFISFYFSYVYNEMHSEKAEHNKEQKLSVLLNCYLAKR